MTNQEIFELMDRFERSAIASLRLADGSFSLELSKACAPMAAAAPAAPVSHTPAAIKEEPAITAPLAGVFYAASEPGAKPYVCVGDRVKQGDTVCLMEAMKMISEVPAPCDCVITEILKENGALAAFDEPIFRYRPC